MILFNRIAMFEISPVLQQTRMNDRPSNWYCSVLWDVGAWVDSHQHLKILPGAEFERMRWPLEHGSCFLKLDGLRAQQEQVQFHRNKSSGKGERILVFMLMEKNGEAIAVETLPWGMNICHLFWCSPQGFDPSPNYELRTLRSIWGHIHVFFGKLPKKVTIIIRLP